MKISLALQPQRPLNRSEALGCLTANLALPGSGSLVAGRRSGYFQLALTAVGFAVSMITGIQFIIWFLNHWEQLHEPSTDDPLGNLLMLWDAIRLPLLGVIIFLAAMAWALMTSMAILRRATPDGVPPKIE